VDDFSRHVVIKTPEAAENPALATLKLGLETTGLNIVDDASGELRALDPAGRPVFTAPRPQIWETRGNDATAPGDPAPAARPHRGRSPGQVGRRPHRRLRPRRQARRTRRQDHRRSPRTDHRPGGAHHRRHQVPGRRRPDLAGLPVSADHNADGRADISIMYNYASGATNAFVFRARPDDGFDGSDTAWQAAPGFW
jgi:hypothetical protein